MKKKQLENTVESLVQTVNNLDEKLASLVKYVLAKETGETKPKLHVSYIESNFMLEVSYFFSYAKKYSTVTKLSNDYSVLSYADAINMVEKQFTVSENKDYILVYDKINYKFYLVDKISERSIEATFEFVSELFKGVNYQGVPKHESSNRN